MSVFNIEGIDFTIEFDPDEKCITAENNQLKIRYIDDYSPGPDVSILEFAGAGFSNSDMPFGDKYKRLYIEIDIKTIDGVCRRDAMFLVNEHRYLGDMVAGIMEKDMICRLITNILLTKMIRQLEQEKELS